MALDPQAQALIAMVYRVGAPRFHELDVHQARRSFEKLQGTFGGEPQPVSSVTDVPIPGVHARDGVIMARLYRPLAAAADAALAATPAAATSARIERRSMLAMLDLPRSACCRCSLLSD